MKWVVLDMSNGKHPRVIAIRNAPDEAAEYIGKVMATWAREVAYGVPIDDVPRLVMLPCEDAS